MWRRLAMSGIPLLLVVLLPIVLRRGEVTDDPGARRLVIVSPHNEAIRFEFEQAFQKHCRETLGTEVDIDWRTPGGTTEIVHYIRSSYVAAFRRAWEAAGERWTAEVEAAFLNRKLHRENASETAWKAREAFLAGNTGIGLDVFFGGGQYDLGVMAATGALVPCGLRDRRPELFRGEPPILSPGLTGETWYDPGDAYYGACLSAFGICYNLDSMAELGYDVRAPEGVLTSWRDLADPRLYGQVGAADPSKSGSITKCFEMILQQRMAEVVASRLPGGEDAAPAEDVAAAVSEGWTEALLLVRMIAGNARYFTFSASKVPLDVAKGDVAAGMCIDFYGRSQAEWEQAHVGRETLVYITPTAGSSLSVDPVGILRGAPHRELAETFVDFVLSRPGQQLWNYRAGTEGGPLRYALRRLPVRRDLYTAQDRERMSDGTAEPFALARQFRYRGDWTGRHFALIRELVRVMAIDCHEELRAAWKAVIDAGGPEAVPEAVEHLRTLPFPYARCGDMTAAIANPLARVRLNREWAATFRGEYRLAELAARQRIATR
ncbi:MAG: extracellular solute-binding protein [Lentisphaeria bacterium]|nr:extracellular solute-binding protein [Lentisphaeria bacterium]